ncbi:MAG: HAD family hydrolase [Acidobacteria bacterium]|nr:HAD family hydrolase [Acidobacteriota bacterium]
MSRLRAVIFDFDGVLIESNALKTRAFSEVFSRFPDHHDAMMAFHHAHVSASRYDKFRHLVAERLRRPHDDPLIGELAVRFADAVRRSLPSCAWVAGAEALLRQLRPHLPLYLASMTPQGELDEAVAARGLSEVFAGVYGCPPWPKALALGDIVRREGGAEGVVFVGDSAGDQRAAAEAGLEFLARDSGLAFEPPLPPAFPDLHAIGAALVDRLA